MRALVAPEARAGVRPDLEADASAPFAAPDARPFFGPRADVSEGSLSLSLWPESLLLLRTHGRTQGWVGARLRTGAALSTRSASAGGRTGPGRARGGGSVARALWWRDGNGRASAGPALFDDVAVSKTGQVST